jgi:transposase
VAPAATGKDDPVPAPHPPEFRRRAIELARHGDQPVWVVAEQLSISESCLRNWMAQADANDAGPGTTAGSSAGSSSRLTRDEKRELTELRREKRRWPGNGTPQSPPATGLRCRRWRRVRPRLVATAATPPPPEGGAAVDHRGRGVEQQTDADMTLDLVEAE